MLQACCCMCRRFLQRWRQQLCWMSCKLSHLHKLHRMVHDLHWWYLRSRQTCVKRHLWVSNRLHVDWCWNLRGDNKLHSRILQRWAQQLWPVSIQLYPVRRLDWLLYSMQEHLYDGHYKQCFIMLVYTGLAIREILNVRRLCKLRKWLLQRWCK